MQSYDNSSPDLWKGKLKRYTLVVELYGLIMIHTTCTQIESIGKKEKNVCKME